MQCEEPGERKKRERPVKEADRAGIPGTCGLFFPSAKTGVGKICVSFDGACRGNGGKGKMEASSAAVIFLIDDKGKVIAFQK